MNSIHVELVESSETVELKTIDANQRIVRDVEKSKIGEFGKQARLESFESIVRQVQEEQLGEVLERLGVEDAQLIVAQIELAEDELISQSSARPFGYLIAREIEFLKERDTRECVLAEKAADSVTIER